MNNLLTLFNLNLTDSFTPHQKPESFFSIVRFILIGSRRSCTGPKYLLPQVERPRNQKIYRSGISEMGRKRRTDQCLLSKSGGLYQHREGQRVPKDITSMRQRLQSLEVQSCSIFCISTFFLSEKLLLTCFKALSISVKIQIVKESTG